MGCPHNDGLGRNNLDICRPDNWKNKSSFSFDDDDDDAIDADDDDNLVVSVVVSFLDRLLFNIFELPPVSLDRIVLFPLLLLVLLFSDFDRWIVDAILAFVFGRLLLVPPPPLGYRNTIRGPFPNWSTTKAMPSTRNDDDDESAGEDIAIGCENDNEYSE